MKTIKTSEFTKKQQEETGVPSSETLIKRKEQLEEQSSQLDDAIIQAEGFENQQKEMQEKEEEMESELVAKGLMKTIKTGGFREAQRKFKDPNTPGAIGGVLGPTWNSIKEVAMGNEEEGKRGLFSRVFKGSILGDSYNIVKDEFGLSKNKRDSAKSKQFKAMLDSQIKTPASDIMDENIRSYATGMNEGNSAIMRQAITFLSKKHKMEEGVMSRLLYEWSTTRRGFGIT